MGRLEHAVSPNNHAASYASALKLAVDCCLLLLFGQWHGLHIQRSKRKKKRSKQRSGWGNRSLAINMKIWSMQKAIQIITSYPDGFHTPHLKIYKIGSNELKDVFRGWISWFSCLYCLTRWNFLLGGGTDHIKEVSVVIIQLNRKSCIKPYMIHCSEWEIRNHDLDIESQTWGHLNTQILIIL